MDNGYMQEIRARILAAEDGAVFVAPDFADIADTATIRQGLKRLYQSALSAELSEAFTKSQSTANCLMNM